MAKITIYGVNSEDLASVSDAEFIEKYAKSRVRRTYKRILENLAYRKLIHKVKKVKESKQKKVIRTHVRGAVILPSWIGTIFGVHNGKEYVTVEIVPAMVGRRLGDFAHTTKRVTHSGPGVGATRGSKFVPVK
ncbi:MAG: ribosomal protein S19 family protein [Candidatus Micrarchaeia archaeon]